MKKKRPRGFPFPPFVTHSLLHVVAVPLPPLSFPLYQRLLSKFFPFFAETPSPLVRPKLSPAPIPVVLVFSPFHLLPLKLSPQPLFSNDLTCSFPSATSAYLFSRFRPALHVRTADPLCSNAPFGVLAHAATLFAIF